MFNNIFDNQNKPLYANCKYTNMDIIKIILSNHLIHVDIIDVYKYEKANNEHAIVEYDPSNTPLPWAIYCKNTDFLNLFNKMNTFTLPLETALASVNPETASETETIAEPETFIVPGTIVNEKAKQNTEKFKQAIGKVYTGTISGNRNCRTRGCKGRRRSRNQHRHGGKYTKRMPNKGKSPVRQTKRIKLKRKTHKRRPT